MRVTLTTDRAGLLWKQHQGQTIDLPKAEARQLIATGQAVLAPDQPPAVPSGPVARQRPEARTVQPKGPQGGDIHEDR
jgi:hypothetical protein